VKSLVFRIFVLSAGMLLSCQTGISSDRRDSLELQPPIKPHIFVIGIGTIEPLTVGLFLSTSRMIWLELSTGYSFVQTSSTVKPEGGWPNIDGGPFLKAGGAWRFGEEPLTYLISLDGGPVAVQAKGNGTRAAFIASFLVGPELRYGDSMEWYVRLGERYCARIGEPDRFFFGFQLGAGWNY
jgi:hypothetical protein